MKTQNEEPIGKSSVGTNFSIMVGGFNIKTNTWISGILAGLKAKNIDGIT